MKFTEYKEQTKRTLPDLGSTLLNSMHMTSGMASEIGEILLAVAKQDEVNVGEEITDLAWYGSNYTFVNDINIDGFEFQKEEMPVVFPGVTKKMQNELDSMGMAILFVSELVDLDKKCLAYGKERDMTHAKAMVLGLLTCIGNLALAVDLDMGKCMENNINKLRVRFPEKFNAAQAINRDTDAERVELEK
jgi:NTP pyrophosphatase (non-canonical NTP hydrolase)